MKIAVVDDLKEDRNLLLDLLRQFFDRYDFKTEYDEFCCAGDFLKTLKPDAYDLVFLDIFMEGMNGMDAARILYRTAPDCMVIFLTTSPDPVFSPSRMCAKGGAIPQTSLCPY